MKSNQLTTINQLQIGDRFHKAGDRKKEVWEVVPNETKVTKYQTYSHWAKKDTERHPQAMKANTPVVFLRSAQANVTGPDASLKSALPVEQGMAG